MHNKSSVQKLKQTIIFVLVFVVALPLNIIFVSALTEEENYKASLAAKGFPVSYHEKLWQMHQSYPNWEFEALNTGVDWNTAVAEENASGKCTVDISETSRLLLSKSWGTYNQDGSFTYTIIDGSQANQTGHLNTTPIAIAFFMDPRNFIGDVKTIFQFEKLAYDSSVHTLEAVEQVVANSFMNNTISYTNTSGGTVNTGVRYAQVILQAGITYNVNPCYLAGKIIQEVGNSGTSGSVSGTVSGYVGYYNYYNIGAYASSTGDAVTNGLKRAKQEGWDSPEKAITGGAYFIANSYISKGQSTAYLQKFNVNPYATSPLFTHQYMSAVHDPAQSSSSTYTGYVNRGTLNNVHKFLIPVFNNMPDASASKVILNDATRYGKCNSDGVNVRASAGVDNTLNPKTGYKLYKGTDVEILGAYRTTNMSPMYYHQLWYPFWYHVRFTATDGTIQTGYVFEDYIDTSANHTININTSKTLGYTLSPAGSTDKPMFMSIDTRIATVDSNGNVVAVGLGTTKIVAFLANGAFDVLPVTVVEGGTTPPVDPPTSITSPTYGISAGYLNVIGENTSVATLKSKINGNAYIKVFDASGNDITSSTDNIGTGAVVRLMNGETVLDTATVVVKGDVTGDGKLSVLDMANIKLCLLGRQTFTGAYLKAANYNNDPEDKISTIDYAQMKTYLLSK